MLRQAAVECRPAYRMTGGQGIYIRMEEKGDWEYVRKLTEIKFDRITRGAGMSGFIYVRCVERMYREIRDRCSPLTPTGQGKGLQVLPREKCL